MFFSDEILVEEIVVKEMYLLYMIGGTQNQKLT